MQKVKNGNSRKSRRKLLPKVVVVAILVAASALWHYIDEWCPDDDFFDDLDDIDEMDDSMRRG